MDTGHFNCRDYYVTEDAGTEKVAGRVQQHHHQHQQHQQRSASSASYSPLNRKITRSNPIPFFELPLELRQSIYRYLLPFARYRNSRSHARSRNKAVIWQRGQTRLLAVCRRMHDECAAMLYGDNVFVISVDYSSIRFRSQWLLHSGLTPTSNIELAEAIPGKYLRLLRKLQIWVDHPDSYTGMIKYNVGGKGLTYGLRQQVEKLAGALELRSRNGRGIISLHLELMDGNEHRDRDKRDRCSVVRVREDRIQGTEDVQSVLDPFRGIEDVREVVVSGAVTEAYATRLGWKKRG